MTEGAKYKNFAVLTLAIQTVEVKESKKGEKYALAQAALPMGEGQPPMPFRVIVTNGLTRVLKAGKTFTLLGRIGYEEKGEEKAPVFLFFPTKFQESEKAASAQAAGAARPRNFAQLTLRAGQDPEGRYTAAGALWCRARMALGQGKDQRGDWKPSLWLTTKAFARAGDETLPQMLNSIEKGNLLTVSGRLAYEVYEEKAHVSLIASKIEGDNAEEKAAVTDDEMSDEPS